MDSLRGPSGWTIIVADARHAGGVAGHERLPSPESDRVPLFRLKADEVRAAARAMANPEARHLMLQMAENYDRLARHVAGRPAAQDEPPEGDASSLPLPGGGRSPHV